MSKIKISKHYGQANFKTITQNLVYEKLSQISIKEKKQQTIINNQIISSNQKEEKWDEKIMECCNIYEGFNR